MTARASDIALAVEVHGVSKRYRVGTQGNAYRTLRDSLGRVLSAPWRPTGRGDRRRDHIWALNDVSFNVTQGEVLGLIGSNGSGKTTLLKILSRITPPTTGHAVVRGRLASLLEVGTGFHPELTGRENILLNGAILGMSRSETRAKLDEIVDFAEIGRFLDTPVKRYSSGMYLRLAFAVAAHLEPNSLLVDEVLAVGDARFQQKCLGKMEQASRGGKTVIFVSHNIAAVRSLCTRVIWIDKGVLVADGPTGEVIDCYLKKMSVGGAGWSEQPLAEITERSGSGVMRFTSFAASMSGTDTLGPPEAGRPMQFVCGYTSERNIPISDVVVGIEVRTANGHPIAYFGNHFEGTVLRDLPPVGQIVCEIPDAPFQAGDYHAVLFCRINMDVADQLERPVPFRVVSGDFFGTGRIPPPRFGDLLVRHSWSTREYGR